MRRAGLTENKANRKGRQVPARLAHTGAGGNVCGAYILGAKLWVMGTKGKMGRSTRLDDELSAKICEIIADGKSNTIAYRTVGIPARTFYDWLQYGRERPDSDFGTFLAAYAEADGLREEKLVAFIMKAAQGSEKQDPDWRAAAFLLSKLYPDRYGDKVKIETESTVHHEVRGTVQVQAILTNLPTNAIRQLREAVDASDVKGLGPGVIPAPSS